MNFYPRKIHEASGRTRIYALQAARLLITMLFCLSILSATASSGDHHPDHKTSVCTQIKRRIAERNRWQVYLSDRRHAVFTDMVYESQPELGRTYANSVATLLITSAEEAKMSPEAVAATAKVESDFNMDSGPCIGIMQINPSTYVEEHGRSGIDPREIHGNLRIGSKELARHYYNSRHCTTERMRLACMWGRYNGCGPHGSYVRRALDLYHEICRAEFKC